VDAEGIAGAVAQQGQIHRHGLCQRVEIFFLQGIEAVLFKGVEQRAAGGFVQADANGIRLQGDGLHTPAVAAQ
jgi:hypothetical protein